MYTQHSPELQGSVGQPEELSLAEKNRIRVQDAVVNSELFYIRPFTGREDVEA